MRACEFITEHTILDSIRNQLNQWMDMDQNIHDPTKRISLQNKVYPFIQKFSKQILQDKGEKGNGDYPASPFAAWLLVQHMDAFPERQGEFLGLLQKELPNFPKLKFLQDRYNVNAWIKQNANKPEYYHNGKPLNNPTVDVRDPAMFKDAGIIAQSREEALANAKEAGNKLLVAAVMATGAKTQPSFQSQSKVNEAPLPPDWDPEQLNLRQTFKNRLKYALDRAKRLGGGSSRVAMTIDYEGRPTALKVAKNLKGLAQNEAEIEILNDYYVGQLPIVIPLIDYDKANKRPVWLQTEIAKKVQAPTLNKMLHTPALWLLTNYVNMLLGKASSKLQKETPDTMKRLYFQLGKDLTEKDYEIFLEYASELASLVDSTSLETGDLQNPANWGVYNGRPVVIDLGFTGETKGLYGYKE